jgi:hypothetical protein
VAIPPSCYVPDYISAADAVLSKLGFGFVSECVVNKTPLIYVPRSSWPEEVALERYIHSVSPNSALIMPVSAFLDGKWAAFLTDAARFKQILLNLVTNHNDGERGALSDASIALRKIGDLITGPASLISLKNP